MSCSDVQTIKAGDGSKTQFSFDFPYIFKSEIHVYFWNATTKEYDEKLTTDSTYPWRITDANPTIVEFTSTAPPAPTTPSDPGEPTVDNVKIRRITKVDDIRALFNPGSAIRSDDLNKNFEQLRYAIQEANCAGIPDDVDQYLKDYYWDRYDNTLYDGDTWVSDDTKIATTAALDARFQDEVNDTFTKAELAAASNIMPNDDVAVPTTGALNDYINEVITNDIGTDGTGITVTDDGDGTITLGLADNTIDFDKIKDADQIKLADQVADYDNGGSDDKVFTSLAAIRRFENYVQDATPSTTAGIGKGAVWLDVEDDKTLSMWDGAAWQAVTSGGTFSNQPKVVYVDASSGSDDNDGHRISRPKKTIKAAVEQINGDSTYGDGSIVSVAPGIYAETLPIDITKNDVGIIGQSLRTCVIHPLIPENDRAAYDVDEPHSQELQTMFRVNSGSYFQNLTMMGLKASGTRGDTGSLYTDTTYGLPPNQGWNFAFYPNAVIKKSPYIQNCTNFSDSQINNVSFTPHTPGEGAAGDLDSAPTGGGILVDGSVPDVNSPLRSMVCDSYTHTALDGPGIFVTNNGYAQCTSSYAFFNHAHITCLNGGQANLAASTTDFGRFALVADGKSPTAIFTSNVDGAAANEATTFNINAPTAASDWFGDATRPANNMLVTVNSVTYPVLSATPRTDSEGGAGFTVEISRPDTSDRSINKGLNGAVSDNAAVSFFLRSMIASSGHTMEYVGSGTNYTALPENGGVPIDSNQIIEINDGKVWTATTDHKGTFKVGDFFTVDQSAGTLAVDSGSFKVDLGTLNLNNDGDAVVGADLDMGTNEITASGGNNLKLNAGGSIDVQTNKIINVVDPTAAQDAATKAYVDANIFELSEDVSPVLGGNLDVNNNEITSSSNGDVTINPNGSGDIVLDANVGIGTASPQTITHVFGADPIFRIQDSSTAIADAFAGIQLAESTSGGSLGNYWQIALEGDSGTSTDHLTFKDGTGERMRIDSSGRLLVGTTSTSADCNSVFVGSSTSATSIIHLGRSSSVSNGSSLGAVAFGDSSQNTYAQISANADAVPGASDYPGRLVFSTTANGAASPTERMRIDSSGNVGIGTNNPGQLIQIGEGDTGLGANVHTIARIEGRAVSGGQQVGTLEFNQLTNAPSEFVGASIGIESSAGTRSESELVFKVSQAANTDATEAMRLSHDGNVGINTTSPFSTNGTNLEVLHDNSSGASRLILNNTDSSGLRYYIQSQNDGALSFGDFASSERMRIDSSGRLLVGLTSAGIGYTGKIVSRNDVNYTSTEFEDNATLLLQNESNNNSAVLVFHSNNSTGSSGRSAIVGGTVNNSRGRLGFYGDVANKDKSTDADVTIDSSGRVGIGTTAPDDVLDVRSGASGFSQFVHSSGDGGVRIAGTGASSNANLVFANNHTAAVSDEYTIQLSGNNDRLAFRSGGTGDTERVSFMADGKVGIGTTSPEQKLHVEGTGSTYAEIKRTTSGSEGTLFLGAASATNQIISRTGGTTARDFRILMGVAEAMRIQSNGRMLVGTTSSDMVYNTSGGGCTLDDTGINVSASGEVVANFNRSTEDGTIVTFRSQGNNEGSVSISGTTTSFNGGHLSRWSQLADGAARTEILRGSVLSNLDEMCVWGEEDNEQLNRMKVSDVEGDVNVSGVFQCWDDDDETYVNDFFCAMTGDFVIRIAQGTTVARGDLLMSAGDGTAKPQDDDIIRSKTIAKVTSTTVSATYSDGSYCVPCVLMAC